MARGTCVRFIAIVVFGSMLFGQAGTPGIRIWDERQLANWATPLALLGVPPGHFTTEEYYGVPADNLRTYPVYPPDREPKGYWEWLQKQKPEPLVDVSRIRTETDWIEAGRRAFRELDIVSSRTNDPKLIAKARDAESFKGTFTLEDGSVLDPRWVVTDQGLMLTALDCSSCHVRLDRNRRLAFAGPLDAWAARVPNPLPSGLPAGEFFERALSGFSLNEQFGIALWRTTAAPWIHDDRVERLRYMMSVYELGRLVGGGTGTVLRTNGSPYYGTKVPDLHVLQYSRYLDATGTHRLRGPEDVARYVALVTGADPMEFGPHRMLSDAQRRVRHRFADEVLYAVGSYLMSLEPPANPGPASAEVVETGRQVFEQTGCGNCHTPPNYTNGMLTLADGFDPPPNHPNGDDILRVSVGTNSGLALKTRKGTGFYKVPSLRGLWYRPFLLHDGSVASLEELFDPARLRPEHFPGGWREPGTGPQAIPGHEFGLDLPPLKRAALLAFLRTL